MYVHRLIKSGFVFEVNDCENGAIQSSHHVHIRYHCFHDHFILAWVSLFCRFLGSSRFQVYSSTQSLWFQSELKRSKEIVIRKRI